MSTGSTINDKLGLKPRTKTRRATHSAALVSSAECPNCGFGHVIENTIHGVRRRMCCLCSHQWDAPPAAACVPQDRVR